MLKEIDNPAKVKKEREKTKLTLSQFYSVMHAFENLKKAKGIIPGKECTYAHSQKLLCIINQEIPSFLKYHHLSSHTTTLEL